MLTVRASILVPSPVAAIPPKVFAVTDRSPGDLRLRSARPAGPATPPPAGPVRVQRRASNSGVVMVAGQKVALGRVHAGQTVTIDVTDTELAIHCDDGSRTIRPT